MATAATKKARAKELERIISHLDTAYEQGEDCKHPDTGIVVTDGEYDGLRRELKELAPKSKLFATATASKVNSAVAKVVHDPPLTSIEKASHEDVATQEAMLFKWLLGAVPDDFDGPTSAINSKLYKDEPVAIPSDYFYQAYKLDGVALALYYEDGLLARAGLRPRDGINGEDVTEQCQYVAGIPKKLKQKVTCSIRGELICKLKDFDKVQLDLANANEKLRANPRNHAAGGIRQFKVPVKTKRMRLSFIAYTIEALDNPPYETELERAAYCNKKLGVPYIETKKFQFADLEKMEQGISKLDFEVDGVIIGVNNLEDQTQLGRHGDPRTGNPKGKIAWKFREEEATPTIKKIEWKTGRTGKISAVAIFDAVRLAGTNVSRATLHNAGFMERNQITIGSTISVRKAGKIIPKVTGVVAGEGKPEFPDSCPTCNAKTQLKEGGSADMLELICTSRTCSAQIISTLCHYLETFGVLGLGESRVTSLVEGGKVEVAADFYELDVEDAMACELTHRQSSLAIAAIHMVPAPDKQAELDEVIAEATQSKKQVPLWKLFASFGIDAAGKSAGKALATHFGSLDAIRNASEEDLIAVEDIGEKTAATITSYLAENSAAIDRLLTHVEPTVTTASGALSGKKFCLSGSFPDGKKHWEQQIEAAGGVCTGSVSKKTDYLVAGPGSGSKSAKAEKLGIPIIDTQELSNLL